ncbi:glycosyltransferase [Elizabethkingia meningoseptica]|uniref:Glycosyltransferase n=1 Tax=Elizabethkingia meningoseptica TaxID=238 RepID=A0A1T3FHI9_ELIME|nr:MULTISPECIES: glycosyltransferase [Elizabethkingia]AQX12417.1 glycosyltransferase [Elizabethkingia meningoseptica]MBG0513954.1 glycosyltransferase [Elizabethkingia meningoseptica]MDE5430513.1 glycosyltransferase [Elizabethkingia meningoseptica]MDE5432869.1 glycosyltransferase [Elizabethkingia meningoseptica]MDE5447974.1 glycosyltransferase [Elizabethkingia meningoseptica]
MKKTIVISAVNLVEAGTLAILRDCLHYLSSLAEQQDYRVVAIVYKKELAEFPNIEYIETQWPKKRWINRLWYEYRSMRKISKNLSPVDLWFSLHDTTPSVNAKRRAVYCHNSYSFYKWKLHDLIVAPKIALFAIFTKYIYKTNIQKNDYLVVQQKWFRDAMGDMFDFKPARIIVAPPHASNPKITGPNEDVSGIIKDEFSFIFAASPNSHKNFEVICKAADILENRYHIKNFRVYLTVKGNENKYAKWLYNKWKLESIKFIGFVKKQTLWDYYEDSNCLIFPSKVETWGLPISEYSVLNKPMLLADLPYAHETAAGSQKVAFFNPDDPETLAKQMMQLVHKDCSFLSPVPIMSIESPVANSWKELFTILLNEKMNKEY